MAVTPKSFYDVIVVGGTLGALASGALLARRGFRVAWVRHDERPNAYLHDECVLLRGPAALPFADTPAFRRLLAELALVPLARRRLRSTDPLYQVVLPSHRLDVRAGGEALITELDREFPEVRRPMEEFYAVLARNIAELDAVFAADVLWPPDGFFERREAHRAAQRAALTRRLDASDLLGDFPADHPFRAFVQAPARFASALDPDASSALRLARAHGLAIRAAMFFEGGRDALAKVLEDKIVQHGGDVLARDRASRIVLERGRVRGVQLAATDEMLGCAFVLTSLDAMSAFRLAEHEPSASLTERLLARTPRYYRYVLNAVVRAEGVPAGMATRVFAIADLARPFSEENLLAIECAPPDARGRAVLTVTALLPRSGVEEGETYLKRQRPRVLAALGRVVPFLQRNLLYVDSPHDGIDLEDRVRGALVPVADRWRSEPESMAVLEAPDREGFLGLSAMPARSEVKGLLLVGPQVVAGIGEEGELMAALSAARIVTRTDRTKERMRRELWSKVEV